MTAGGAGFLLGWSEWLSQGAVPRVGLMLREDLLSVPLRPGGERSGGGSPVPA